MLKLFMFDMGGVMVRDFHIAPKLLPFLGRSEPEIGEIAPEVRKALKDHSKGLIDEAKFWEIYRNTTLSSTPGEESSLLGKFFTPVLDPETVQVIQDLKQKHYRVICGTNVIDAHYRIHQNLKQYEIFDHVYASHLIHQAKPNGTFFQHILEKEKIAAHEVFFTDDMEENVESAIREGLVAYRYTDASSLRLQLIENGVL